MAKGTLMEGQETPEKASAASLGPLEGIGTRTDLEVQLRYA